MFQPLEDATFQFADARDAYLAASKAQDAEAAVPALVSALAAADAILSFLGYIDPYECGDCDACQANAAARRSEMQTAVDADPVLSPSLSDADEATFRSLMTQAFGDTKPEGDAA